MASLDGVGKYGSRSVEGVRGQEVVNRADPDLYPHMPRPRMLSFARSRHIKRHRILFVVETSTLPFPTFSDSGISVLPAAACIDEVRRSNKKSLASYSGRVKEPGDSGDKSCISATKTPRKRELERPSDSGNGLRASKCVSLMIGLMKSTTAGSRFRTPAGCGVNPAHPAMHCGESGRHASS